VYFETVIVLLSTTIRKLETAFPEERDEHFEITCVGSVYVPIGTPLKFVAFKVAIRTKHNYKCFKDNLQIHNSTININYKVS